MKTERELFEEWAYKNKWNIFRVRDMGLDQYVDDFVDGAWFGWQASENREGYKSVSVEIETLQNRIDEALRTIEPSDEITHSLYRKVYNILKGEN